MLKETIETDRLVLRQITYEDAPDLLEFFSQRDTAYWAGMPLFTEIDQVEDYIEMGNFFQYALYGITVKDSDKVMGMVNVNKECRNANPIFTIGYLISPEVAGQGYMTEAVQAVCQCIFQDTKIDEIMLEIRPDNIPSRRVAQKCGFTQNPDQVFWRSNYYGKPLDQFLLHRAA